MGKYDDIINLERPISKNHRPMALENRAAQFMPFAALTGYDDAVEETGRLTADKIELTEERIRELDEKLSELGAKLQNGPVKMFVTYFVPDLYKSGGEYVTSEVTVRKIDSYKKCLILTDKSEIFIHDIYDLWE
ncbi:hypothetical protein [Butyrivibrio sp. WCD3002]|jgi:hypothetical protein|uniref:hypothetical protein n=1 Tax=Butyrivibrio sp. WCD3002 TaxID=1280676 RepID=UPI00041A751C|nr:hypothetical protein [Butyrivibrio sp. WCD3002]